MGASKPQNPPAPYKRSLPPMSPRYPHISGLQNVPALPLVCACPAENSYARACSPRCPALGVQRSRDDRTVFFLMGKLIWSWVWTVWCPWVRAAQSPVSQPSELRLCMAGAAHKGLSPLSQEVLCTCPRQVRSGPWRFVRRLWPLAHPVRSVLSEGSKGPFPQGARDPQPLARESLGQAAPTPRRVRISSGTSPIPGPPRHRPPCKASALVVTGGAPPPPPGHGRGPLTQRVDSPLFHVPIAKAAAVVLWGLTSRQRRAQYNEARRGARLLLGTRTPSIPYPPQHTALPPPPPPLLGSVSDGMRGSRARKGCTQDSKPLIVGSSQNFMFPRSNYFFGFGWVDRPGWVALRLLAREPPGKDLSRAHA